MKIAMVGQFPPHVGGVGVHIHTLSKELVKQGHEVYVITYPHKDIEDIDGIHVINLSNHGEKKKLTLILSMAITCFLQGQQVLKLEKNMVLKHI